MFTRRDYITMPKEFDSMVDKIRGSLKKQHPEWDPERINNAAYGTAMKNWKKRFGRPPIRE